MRGPVLRGPERAEVRDAMRTAYEDERLTIAQVAARFGRSYGNTHQLLIEADARIRPQGGPRG